MIPDDIAGRLKAISVLLRENPPRMVRYTVILL